MRGAHGSSLPPPPLSLRIRLAVRGFGSGRRFERGGIASPSRHPEGVVGHRATPSASRVWKIGGELSLGHT
jgi:hypothetical protein